MGEEAVDFSSHLILHRFQFDYGFFTDFSLIYGFSDWLPIAFDKVSELGSSSIFLESICWEVSVY